MANFTLTAQNVNGDPFLDGKNINITNNSYSDLTFIDVDDLLGVTQTGEYVSFDGGTTLLSYEFLGYGDVRNDPSQHAGFIRIDMGDGTFVTVAIDMNADGDRLPNLSNGNTKLKVADLDNSSSQAFPPPPCFLPGTLIETDCGPRPVERLAAGDRVMTADAGLQTVLWAGSRLVDGSDRQAPVLIRSGTLGNATDLLVSPQHRVLISGAQAQRFYGHPEVLVPARHLVNGTTILRRAIRRVRYCHILLAQHQLLRSAGCWTESFFPGACILEGDPKLAREIAAVIGDPEGYGGLARPVLKRREAQLLQLVA